MHVISGKNSSFMTMTWCTRTFAILFLSFYSTNVSSFSAQQQQQQQPPTTTTPQSRQAGYSVYWKTQEKPKDVLIVDEMPPSLPDLLKNQYYLLRHGQSTGNVEGVISSDRSLATSNKHGLTVLGYEQGKRSAQQLFDILRKSRSLETNHAEVLFYSSPFARARQTARACLDGLAEMDEAVLRELKLNVSTDIEIHDGLMERYFGRLDDAAIHTYAYVWPVDKFNVTHTAFGVESVAAVATRLRNVILHLEERHDQQHIVLVSHADVLQICQLYAAGAENVGTFSSYRFGNGEVRAMKRTVDSLPEPQPLKPPQRGT